MKSLVLFAIAQFLCSAQECNVNSSAQRYALVVGNGAYDHTELAAVPTALNEAQAVKKALEGARFRVTLVENATMPDLISKEETSFQTQIQPGDIVFLYYSGHVVQGEDGDDYLLPTNFDPASEVNSASSASLGRFLDDFVDRKAGLKIVAIEGPRRLAVALRGTSGSGLPAPDLRYRGEALFAMSAQPGELVDPPAAPQAALFTQSLVHWIETPGTTVEQAFDGARREVAQKTDGSQNPYINSTIVGSNTFCFFAPPPPPITERETPPPATPAPPPIHTATDRRDHQEYVFIPAGRFKMGCVTEDSRCSDSEKPQHEVVLTSDFWLGRTEVTVSAYKHFVDVEKVKMPRATVDNRGWRSGDLPMVNVGWNEAQGFCKWAGGRLPTEAEWEYAARSGKDDEIYPLNSENSREKANFFGKQGNDTYEFLAPVRSFDANGFNLFDMAGNVWEWVQDWYNPKYYANSPAEDPPGPMTGTEHGMRGGSFDSDWKQHLRLSFRDSHGGPANNIGFRCLLPSEDETKKLLNLP